MGREVYYQNIKNFVYVVVDIWIHDSSDLVASHLTKSEQSGQNFYDREKFLIIEKFPEVISYPASSSHQVTTVIMIMKCGPITLTLTQILLGNLF